MEGKKVLVTGASGFVGQALSLELCRHNKVYGLARFRDTKVKHELEEIGATIIQKDVHRENLDDLPRDFDYVFSSLAMIMNCDVNREDAYDVNTYFVGRLMDCCRSAAGVVLISTGGVYLPGPRLRDEQSAIGPRNTYGVSKFGGEVLGRFLCLQWQIPTCILRYLYPYGLSGGTVTEWARQVVRGEEIPVNRQSPLLLNPIYMSDCIRYTIEAAELCSVPAKIINIAGEEVMSQTEIVTTIAQAVEMEPIFRDTEETSLSYLLSVDLIKRLLGPPTVPMREGLARVARSELRRHRGDSFSTA